MYRYRARAVCKATVTETWTIASPRPLTDDEVIDMLGGHKELHDDVAMDCTNEEVSDEEDREVTEVELLDVED